MCGRYIQVQKIEAIEKRFNVKVPEEIDLQPNFNISPGQYAPVIANNNPKEVQLFQFGLTPFWAKKPMYLFNARAEGDKNIENNIAYKGAKDIIIKPAFRKPIRSQRCIVIADAFIEGTTKERLNKPYVVYLRNHEGPFAFAGIWDTWKNAETKEEIHSFAIITTVANELLQKLPHHRSPVILPKQHEEEWLSSTSLLSDVTKLLEPYPSKLMNAYPISNTIKNPRANGRHLINPFGERIFPEYDYKEDTLLELHGMGSFKLRKKSE